MADSSASKHRHRRPGRRRFAPLAVVAGVVASAAIATSMTGTLGAFVASITNDVNTTSTGVLTMQETGVSGTGVANTTCSSTDTAAGTGPSADQTSNASNTINSNAYYCSTINKYGGSLTFVPGSSATQVVSIKNTGTVTTSSFTLAAGTCTNGVNGAVSGSSSDLCSKLNVTVYAGATATGTPIVATKSLTAFAGTSTTLTNLIAGNAASYTFVVNFPTGGTNDNTYQGRSVSQPLTWTFTAGS